MTRTKTNAADDGREEAYNAMTERCETVHSAGEWRLTVWADGSVETRDLTTSTRLSPFTTRGERGMKGERFRCGKTIEGILARYAHETRNDRSAEEHGAALRHGIINALCAIATDATCGRSECNGEATHVRHVNAPTGPSTALVCDECATGGTYVTLYALDEDTDNEAGESP